MGHYAINKQSWTNWNIGSGAVSMDSLAGGHSVGTLTLWNPNSANVYFQFFYKEAGSVNVGSTVPDVVIMVAANTSLPIPVPGGWWAHGNLSVAVTTTPNGNNGPTSLCGLSVFYG